MEQVPKIVAQRLQAVWTGTHPDANLLAGFAEKSLLPREQALVMDHLAGCAMCREVVSFSQPQGSLEIEPAAAPARTKPWLHSAAVRWAALAACVVVVSAVVISRAHFKGAPEGRIASYQQAVEVAKTEPAPAPSEAPADAVATRRDERNTPRLQDKLDNGRTREAEPVAGLEKRQLAMAVPKPAEEAKPLAGSSGELDTKQKVSALNETVEVSSATVPVETQTVDEAKANKKEFSPDKAMKASAGNDVALAPAISAAPPAAPQAKGAPVASVASNRPAQSESVQVNGLYRAKDGYAESGAAVAPLRSGVRLPTPRWQLSSEGKLLRSGDLGETWQPVTFQENVIFHALCVNGREVWVGGSQGNLFHSPNGGESWEQIKPLSNGQTLTGNIIGIEFKDLQHGKVLTADHQTWTTTDDGHTWSVEAR